MTFVWVLPETISTFAPLRTLLGVQVMKDQEF